LKNIEKLLIFSTAALTETYFRPDSPFSKQNKNSLSVTDWKLSQDRSNYDGQNVLKPISCGVGWYPENADCTACGQSSRQTTQQSSNHA